MPLPDREEVAVEHEPVGEVVTERVEPWQEADGTYVVPMHEERLVVVKRLVLRERIRIRRVGTTERQLFEDTLRRERLVVEDPQHTGRVREVYPADEEEPAAEESDRESGFFEGLVRKALE
jgi:stress response protein YsnF